MTMIYERMLNGRFHHSSYGMKDTGTFYQMMPLPKTFKVGSYDATDVHAVAEWKFHLSIHPDDVPKAWEIACDLIFKQNNPVIAKVSNPRVSQRMNIETSIQAGKMITFYTYKDIDHTQNEILVTELESRLRAAGIRRGAHSNADREIPGAEYTSYRCDKDSYGRYISSRSLSEMARDKRHNPFDLDDPYENFTVTHAVTPHLDKHFTSSSHEDNTAIARMDWVNIHKGAKSGVEIVLGDLDNNQQAQLMQFIEMNDIDYITKNSTAQGGKQVIRVMDPQADKYIRPLIEYNALARASWLSVTNRHREPALYLDIAQMEQRELARLKAGLSRAFIEAEEKDSSINGGTRVLAIQGRDNIQNFQKLNNP